MTWRLIIIAVLIVLLIPTMALLRKQEAVKKTGDKEQIAARCSMCILRNFRKKTKVFCKKRLTIPVWIGILSEHCEKPAGVVQW